jgi:hypothetical protein
MWFMKIARCSLLRSNACPETSLLVKCKWWRVHVNVGIDAHALQCVSSPSWISSR